ncbi:hypothetical protein [Anabaena sp. CA = ATCC 33047]|uniref:hypothetical protein n=1 Tax=Anabaena sp. (strain CA / ATCC 33047) TaxID=52271 RepID=UPI00082F9189|nr:hypothetical protein [Anabaena sp. CA = ATCC 33047]
MLNNKLKIFPLHRLRIPAIAFLFTLGAVGEQAIPVLSNRIAQVPNSIAIAASLPELTHQPQKSSKTSINSESITSEFTSTLKAAKNSGITQKADLPLKDGVYLYGQSPQPNQLGQGYVVFQKRQGKIVGALYMPRSEFSCFQGTLDKSGELAMTVTGTPDAGIAPDVATASTIPTFSVDQPATYAHSLALQDYHQINSISGDDRRVLQMCNH